MQKILIAALLSIGLASSSFAGSAIYAPPPEAEVVVAEPEAMGSSTQWWIPLLAIGAIILLMNDRCESNNSNQACGNGA